MKLHIRSVLASRPAIIIPVSEVGRQSFAQAIWLSGQLPARPLCSGLSTCGRCQVRFVLDPPVPSEEERSFFSPDKINQGWRLGCRHHLPLPSADSICLELPDECFVDSANFVRVDCQATVKSFLAVDLGTTSVCWQALDCEQATVLASGQFVNPQAGAGADVVSRLAIASNFEGRGRLSSLVRRSLVELVSRLKQEKIEIEKICLAANTAMTGIFLDLDVSGLCAAPYGVDFSGNMSFSSQELPEIYIPPFPAPFVGGDIGSGLAMLMYGAEANRPAGACHASCPFVLADLGTNAELALVAADGDLYVASLPMGPALEGVGPECGQAAGPDVITSFSLGPGGLLSISPDGSQSKARGISASAYISLLACLLRLGIIDNDGHFSSQDKLRQMPLAHKIAGGKIETNGGQKRLILPRGVWLSSGDIEEFLKIRAVFAVAMKSMLAAAGLGISQLSAIFLAGALGEHIDPDALEYLGFIPQGTGKRIVTVGNTALSGAGVLLFHPEVREKLVDLCEKTRIVSLTEDSGFQSRYLAKMHFGV